MSAISATPTKLTSLEFWKRFCAEVERRIGEVNAISGQRFWQTSSSTEPCAGISIRRVDRPADHIMCVFDHATCVLTCSPGPEVAFGGCSFQWIGTTDTLRRETEEFTLPETLNLLLDTLVWPEE